MDTITLTVTGATLEQAVNRMREHVEEFDAKTASAGPSKPAKKKAKPAPVEELDEEIEVEELDEEIEDDVEELDEEIEDEDDKPAPKAKAKAPAKAAKLTEKDVNAAAIAHAKKNGRKATLTVLLKKFKVKSILELKPDQYASAIAALK